MTLYRGDQYAVPFIVKLKDEIVTPETATDVRIQIGSDLREMTSHSLNKIRLDVLKTTPVVEIDISLT